MQISRILLNSLLDELAQWLEFEDAEPVEWVVCGGAAMALQNLNPRTTQDVDVLCVWNSARMEIACIDDFPPKVKVCIRRVVENHPELVGLGEKWINLGPSRLARLGLPKGFEQRWTTIKFRERLTLCLLGRVDLLPLKLYAAADELGPRQEVHFQDLRVLRPSFDELDAAVGWVRTLPDFEEKRPAVRAVVERLGYDDLAYYV